MPTEAKISSYVNEERLFQFLTPVVKATTPEYGGTTWSAGGQDLIGDALVRKDFRPQQQLIKGDHKFIEEAKVVLEIVGLISSTLQVINEVIQRIRPGNEPETSVSELRRDWATRLQTAGLAKEKAEKVAEQFSADLSELLKQSSKK